MKNALSPRGTLSGQILLGTEAFVRRAKELLDGRENIPVIPRMQRHVGRPSLDVLFPPGTDAPKKERNRLIQLAQGSHGYTLKEIAQTLGVHNTAISKVINSLKD